jgi:hypothetical protein
VSLWSFLLPFVSFSLHVLLWRRLCSESLLGGSFGGVGTLESGSRIRPNFLASWVILQMSKPDMRIRCVLALAQSGVMKLGLW